MIACFSQSYPEARDKFLAAARKAGARLARHDLNRTGPDGGGLSTDVALVGPEDASAVLVTISGTHGVEGFFGSATQVEWLTRGEATELKGAAALHIHAINPYGFAWLRRTNEDNVDINRNWIDFNSPLPANDLYDELAADLCPPDWSADTQARTGARIQAWIGGHGLPAFQKAVSGGQWAYPNGLFYGGTRIGWSRRILTDILTTHLRKASRVCVVDFHTGLGPYGYAEPIIGRSRQDPEFARVSAWVGGGGRSLFGDGSVSAEIKGDSLTAIPGLLPQAKVDAVALECGIRPVTEVALALRADAWLHAHGDPLSDQAKPIKAMIRGAFHSDDPVWQGMALGQGLAGCRAALGGLRQP
jgi:Protein of unknown function (DUF2817)